MPIGWGGVREICTIVAGIDRFQRVKVLRVLTVLDSLYDQEYTGLRPCICVIETTFFIAIHVLFNL